MINPTHVIISRTDNIGDVILTLPLAALIKQQWPACKISFIARDYVADIIKSCPDVDHFISWNELRALSFHSAVQQLKAYNADTIIHAFPNKQIAKLAKAAKIKLRIGTSHRFYHRFNCNKRVNFSRKNSFLHEAQLNLKLLTPLELNKSLSLSELASLIHLQKKPSNEKVNHILDDKRFNLVIHPLTNGNTKEWSLQKFSELINLLSTKKFNIIMTGTNNEQQRLQMLISKYPNLKNAIGVLSLQDFINLLGHADGIVVNSTGPLHIAAGLGIHALGLFPPQKGKDPGRWGPLGQQAEFLLAEECIACETKKQDFCTCMDNISAKHVATIVESWLN